MRHCVGLGVGQAVARRAAALEAMRQTKPVAHLVGGGLAYAAVPLVPVVGVLGHGVGPEGAAGSFYFIL